RLWVVEMRDYPNGMDGQGNPGGRVKVLEDSDGDGRYDRASVFLDALPFPTGVKVWRDGVLISAAPDILFARDNDGDGQAEVVEKLYTGFGEGNQQHRVNGLRWGLDNWLHVGNGDSNGKIRSHKTGEVVDVSGRDLRICPDDGLHEATSGNTQFGRERNDWGDWFGGNNSNPMWHYVLEDRYLRRNPHVAPPSVRKHVSEQPGAAPVFPVSRTLERFNDFAMAGRFTSACSPVIYRDMLLGEEYVGNSFVCEPVHNLVHREVVEADGVTFTSRRAEDEQQSEFFASRDNWCRPSMVRVGPDGALWIADMYRFVIEHPRWIPEDWLRRLDVRAGDDKGRIYRVYPADAAPRPPERLDTLDEQGLVAQLKSPSGWQRDMAHQMLLWQGGEAAIAPLTELVASGESPQARVHAICVLDGLGALDPDLLLRAAGDEHPGVRRHAVRLSEPWLNESPELAAAVAKLAGDANPFVRLQVAYSLGEWDDLQWGPALAALARAHHNDPYVLAAVFSSIDQENLPEMLEAVLAAESPPAAVVQKLLAMAAAVGEAEMVNRVLASLAATIGEDAGASQMAALAEVIETLGARKAPVSKMTDAATRQQLTKVFAVARERALDESASPADRRAAVRLLGSGLGDSSAAAGALGQLLTPRTPAELQSAAVAALARIGSPQAFDTLLAAWRGYSPAIRGDALDAMLSRIEGAQRLLDAVESGALPASQLEARRRQQLLTHKDAGVRKRAEQLIAHEASTDRVKVVQEFQHVARLGGDVARGKEVFRKRCATCHRLEGEGHAVGPDLTALTNKSPEAMLIAMLDPNRAVEDKFLDYIVVTADGRQFTGLLREETGASITLEAPDAKQQVVLRKDIDVLAATGRSLMPEGIEKDMTADDLADVIAYVRSVGPPPKEFPGNNPQVVRVSINGRLDCSASSARIYGPTLVFEERYGNLGYWQSEEDRAVWTIDVPKPGRYVVRLDYSCPPEAAGDAFVVEIAGQSLTGRVESTGSWDMYRGATLGVVELSPGLTDLQFRSAGAIRQALLDLRQIRLTPAE
ncbi:MAG: HEAT repeat domain-containing protein, partial [Planctomycetes bacterium]|nr:HEAT repeat domain-containing protein [Planctomycetota bacterium]